MLAIWNKAQRPPAEARLFFGLWPDAATVKRLQAQTPHLLRQLNASGRALAPPHWHITLAFLGKGLTPQQWQQLKRLPGSAASIAAPSALRLDRVNTFSKAQVLWLGLDPLSAGNVALQQAQQALWQQLTPLGWQPEDRAFVPHVSLLRQATSLLTEPILLDEPILWHTAALKLIVSLPNAERSEYYQVR